MKIVSLVICNGSCLSYKSGNSEIDIVVNRFEKSNVEPFLYLLQSARNIVLVHPI